MIPPAHDRSARDADDAAVLDDILEHVRRRHHYDFGSYARPSLERRMRRAANRLGCDGLAELHQRLRMHPHVFDSVLDDLTIRVTAPFRDPWHFADFRTHVIPRLATYPSRRLWVAGCSTGEEAWSLAILLAEAGLLARTQIYATDISQTALRAAERARYPLAALGQWSDGYTAAGGVGRITDHLVVEPDGLRIDDRLRRAVLFADHCIATDASFAEVQAVSCRNVLIYFDRSLQARALALFADSLSPRGFLGMGVSESLHLTRRGGGFAKLAATEGWHVYLDRGRIAPVPTSP